MEKAIQRRATNLEPDPENAMLTPPRATILLRCILVFNGIMTLLALPAVFLPTAWMDAFHRGLELGPLPQGPIVQYLARSISCLYAAFASLTLLLAYDLKRYAPLVIWWGVMAVLFGLLLFWIDKTARMPEQWTWGEGPYLVLTGLVVLMLVAASRRSQCMPA